MFNDGKGDRGSIPGHVIPKTQKMVLNASFFNTQHYKVQIKSKSSNLATAVVLYPTLHCSSNWKETPMVK